MIKNEDEVSDDDLQHIIQDEKHILLLSSKRPRVTTMSFNDWFIREYKRNFKQANTALSEAYHAGASDEIENNNYLLDYAHNKENHYKERCIKPADQVQILYSLLSTVNKKVDAPENIKRLIRKVLSGQEWYLTSPTLRQPLH